MARYAREDDGRRGTLWRLLLWGAAAPFLLAPLVAMQFSDEVDWGVADFIVFGTLLAAAGGACELAVRSTRSIAFRAAAGLAVVTAFFLVWVTLAVGIVGNEGHPANLMFFGVLLVGIAGAALARFRPAGMARALAATAFAQLAAGMAALATGAGSGGPIWPLDILGLTGFFTTMWLISAWLFRGAGSETSA